jgi:N-formylglutamate amidohydrolase
MWEIKYRLNRLVSRHQGTLPVILTCPHDGTEIPAGVTEERSRKGTPAGCNFETNRDLETRALTTELAHWLLEICGEAPYVVIAEFKRTHIDANRSANLPVPTCAFEHPAAQQYYDEYHHTIRDFIDEIRTDNGGLGLLFDIHGTVGVTADPADLYLGTHQGVTIERLLSADSRALTRQRSLRGFLAGAGYTVSPTEHPNLRGGFTVQTYGSSHADGLDAIQLEIDDRVRTDPEKRRPFVEQLAHAIGHLVRRWADVHALAAVHNLTLVSDRIDQEVAGQLKRGDPNKNDWLLQLGGTRENRGRIEIRHDPGDVGGGAPRRAGVLVLYGENGNDHYVWVDNQGKLRISASDPGASSQAGTIVGTQS